MCRSVSGVKLRPSWSEPSWPRLQRRSGCDISLAMIGRWRFLERARCAAAGFLVVAGCTQAAGLVVNEDGSRLASLPSFDVHPGGRVTFVWSSYARGLEWMWSVTEEGGRMGKTIQLSPGYGVYCEPRFVAVGDQSGWAFWTRQREGRWEVVGRRLGEGRWAPVVILSSAGTDAMAPDAVTAGESVVLVWEEHGADSQRIVMRIWDGRAWSNPAPVSEGEPWAYRPALAADGRGQVWAAWDAYLAGERSYAVYLRPVYPERGEPVRVSPFGSNCLKPSIAYAAGAGPAVAWVATSEVIGGAGVLDHWDSIQAALLRAGRWELSRAEDGGADIVPLQFGLLPRIEPEFEAVWGYSGRRRHPMLVEDGGSLWLLWERRIGSGDRSREPGRLCARRWSGRQWGRPAVVHEGLVEYGLPESGRARQGRIVIAGRDTAHKFCIAEVDLKAGKPFNFELYEGWKPVRLPRRDAARRPSVEIRGKRYNLYWGDLHVHSALTSDAEGEVDELMHFARDKARLDVVVIQENDSNSWHRDVFLDHRLTESEYRRSIYFSRRYSEAGRFVALPGWEWSQRLTEDRSTNHRTVMFAGPDTPIVRHTENGNNFDELCEIVEAAGGNMFTQHPVFRLSGCPADTNVEVASGWGIYLDPPDKIHADLSAGHRVGFVATSDGHRRNPGTGGGLTAIFAPELTPEAILDALKSRRVYATNGSRIFLEARANGAFMGEDAAAEGTVALTLTVAAPELLRRAVLVRDGEEIHVEPGSGRKELELRYTDRPGEGFHWYYWRVELEGEQARYGGNVKPAEGRYAWSSPHRVQVGAVR